MLSVERTKELLSSLNLSDEEAEYIRDISFMFADLAYEAWLDERKKIADIKKQELKQKLILKQ